MFDFADRMGRVTTSAVREIIKLMADPQIISFGGGSPAKEAFPIKDIQNITADILKNDSYDALQYGVTEGYRPLIEAYIKYMANGLDVENKNVLILTGSNQGINLAIDVLINPGDTVLVESPTFLATLIILNKYQANCIPVQTDENGIIISDLEDKIKKHNPKLLYTIPTFQNPTGKTLSSQRRETIASLASKHKMFVLEDDPYRDLRYFGEELPSIKHFDKSGYVVLLNSFSKILAPGLRVGVAVAHEEIIQKMVASKQCSDTHTANLSQMICARYLESGRFSEHLGVIKTLYKERMMSMLECIEREFPKGTKYTKPQGGLFIWVELPKNYNTNELIKIAAQKQKVAFVPGSPFFLDPNDGKNTLRLNFSASDPKTIEVGMKRLGKIF